MNENKAVKSRKYYGTYTRVIVSRNRNDPNTARRKAATPKAPMNIKEERRNTQAKDTLALNGQIISRTTTNGFPGEKVATSRSAISEKANRTQCRVYSVNITPLDTQPPLCAAHNTPLPRYPFPQVPRLTPAQRNNADGMCGSPNIRQVLRDMDTGAGKWDRGPGIGGWSTL